MSGEPPPTIEALAARARVDVDPTFSAKSWARGANKLLDQVDPGRSDVEIASDGCLRAAGL